MIKKLVNKMFEKKDNMKTVEEIDTEISEHDSINDEVVKRKFNVMNIEKISTPDGMVGDNWYQYVVGQGSSEIKGLTMGTLKQVTEHANRVADYLNDRSKGKKTGYSSSQNNNTPAKPVS
jgi:hypothetical protein